MAVPSATALSSSTSNFADDQSIVGQAQPTELAEGATAVVLGLARFEDSDDSTPLADYPDITAGEDITTFTRARCPDSVGAQVNIFTSAGRAADVTVSSTASGKVLYADDRAICVNVTVESEVGYQISGVITALVR